LRKKKSILYWQALKISKMLRLNLCKILNYPNLFNFTYFNSISFNIIKIPTKDVARGWKWEGAPWRRRRREHKRWRRPDDDISGGGYRTWRRIAAEGCCCAEKWRCDRKVVREEERVNFLVPKTLFPLLFIHLQNDTCTPHVAYT